MIFGVKKNSLIFASVVWLVLLASFFVNFFGVGLNNEWFDYFQKDSSLIVEKTAECKGQLSYDGPVVPGPNQNDFMGTMTSDDCTAGEYNPYTPQFGFQARVVAFFAPGGQEVDRYFRNVSFLLAATTALIMTAIVHRIRQLFGLTPAIVVAALTAISVWIVGYARNLYWVEPLMLAPFAFAFITYPWFKRKGRLWVFYLVVTALLFMKLLNGYEHVSTISLSVFVPIVFYELGVKNRRVIDLWRHAAVTFGVTVIAFIGAYSCNVAALSTHYGSLSSAIQAIQARSEARSLSGLGNTKKDVILNFEATVPEAYQATKRFMNIEALRDGNGFIVKYLAISVLNYMLLPAITLPIDVKGMFGVVLESIVLWSVLGYIAIRLLKRSLKFAGYYRPLWWSYWLSLGGALSWLVLMPGHAFPHAHLNGIIFYLPHLLLCYMAIGMKVADYLPYRRRAARKRG